MNRTIIKRIIQRGTCWAAGAGLLLIGACSPSPVTTDGGGTRGGNPVVVGTIAGLDGALARGVQVFLIAEDYNPVVDAPLSSTSIDTTDSCGIFTITAPDSGRYTVEAVEKTGGARLLRFNVRAISDSVVVVPVDTLHRPGTIKVHLATEAGDSSDAYVYVPGTTIAKKLSGARDSVVLDSVPAGTLPVLYYVQGNSMAGRVARYGIAVRSDETTLVENPQWPYFRRIVLNTTAAGAGVNGDVHKFPVLVRLTSGNFDFTQSSSNGEDLLFIGAGNVPLASEVERWDAAGKRAEVWVRIDTVFGNDSMQSIMMYWGNIAAGSASERGMVFDTAAGFQGVWHLGDAAQDSVSDATVNRYSGVSPDTARPAVGEGVIGNCRKFDGTADFITMPKTSESKLTFPESGQYTVSAWVFLDTLDGASHCIVSKGYEQYYLRSTYISMKLLNTTPLWEFVEFGETAKWQTSNSTATVRQWALLVGVRQGNRQLLYCNGVLVDSTIDVWQNAVSRSTANDLTIGKFAKAVTVPIPEGYCYFKGGIDEVRIISSAQSSDWVRLCYQNQRSDDRLVVFR